MSILRGKASWQTRAGEPIVSFGRRVTPLSRALVVRCRGTTYVWNRPYAIQVEDQADGSRRLLPVIDRTLHLQLVAMGLGLTLAWLLTQVLRRRREAR